MRSRAATPTTPSPSGIAEPTPDTDKLPLGTGWPLAPLYAFGPLYAHLCYAAAGDMTLGEFVRFLFD